MEQVIEISEETVEEQQVIELSTELLSQVGGGTVGLTL